MPDEALQPREPHMRYRSLAEFGVIFQPVEAHGRALPQGSSGTGTVVEPFDVQRFPTEEASLD
jgi:hypothetical protein